MKTKHYNKEREQHSCLQGPSLMEIIGRQTENAVKKEDTILGNLCQICKLKTASKKLKTKDKVEISLCEECYQNFAN